MRELILFFLLSGCAVERRCPNTFMKAPSIPVVFEYDASVPAEHKPLVESAARRWNNAVGTEVIKLGQSTNKIIFHPTTWEYGENTLGVTRPAFGVFGISTFIEYRARSLNLEQLFAHEMGHALGVDHINDPYNIMYPATNYITREISHIEIEAVRCLYAE